MKIFGGILLAVGILISGLSGLCTTVLLVSEAGNPNADLSEGLWIVMLFGGVPFLIGLGMVYCGWRIFRQKLGA